ncbi:44128_t:CDS:2 [Gigaspora margarita]|uniref:44128_t:CDS:1 n=1 Tax=Gigaspora margarita TaxID=4874 RepID=A0ABN7VEV9_GIGMA|nr:44128_t:CDS:2 [Gigaspora margarita]
MTQVNYQYYYTHSTNLTPKEGLEKFLTEHIKYLQREKRWVEQFFKKNGINGENLETNLEELKKSLKKRMISLKKGMNRITIADQNLRIGYLQDQIGKFSFEERILRYQEINRFCNENQFLNQVIERRMIKEAISKICDENHRFNQNNQHLYQDLEIVTKVYNNRIATQDIQIRNLQERVEQYSAELRERDKIFLTNLIIFLITYAFLLGICTILIFAKQDAFFFDDDNMDTN